MNKIKTAFDKVKFSDDFEKNTEALLNAKTSAKPANKTGMKVVMGTFAAAAAVIAAVIIPQTSMGKLDIGSSVVSEETSFSESSVKTEESSETDISRHIICKDKTADEVDYEPGDYGLYMLPTREKSMGISSTLSEKIKTASGDDFFAIGYILTYWPKQNPEEMLPAGYFESFWASDRKLLAEAGIDFNDKGVAIISYEVASTLADRALESGCQGGYLFVLADREEVFN